MRRLWLVGCLVIIPLSVASCARVGPPTAGPHIAPRAEPTTIYINPPRDTKYFSPPPLGVQAKLDAEEAVAAFERVDAEFTLPPDAVAQLGLFTDGSLDGVTFAFDHQLAWGYSWHQCGSFAHSVPPDTKVLCTEWLFLDADTGEQLENVWAP